MRGFLRFHSNLIFYDLINLYIRNVFHKVRKDYYLRLFWCYNLVFEVDIPLKNSRNTIKKEKALPAGYGKRNVQQIPREF